MIHVMDKKTLQAMRDGVTDGMGGAWKEARKQAGRVELRAPWVYNRPSSAKRWYVGFVILSGIAGVIAGMLYMRKRKQVSGRYNKGGEPTAGETAGESLNSVHTEDMLSSMS